MGRNFDDYPGFQPKNHSHQTFQPAVYLPFDVEVNKNSKMVSSVHYMWYVCEVKVDSITALLCLITYVQGGEKN